MSNSRSGATVTMTRKAAAEARRNAVIVAARQEFATKGMFGSLEAIARLAGVGIGTLYRYFPTREELFDAVYNDEVEALIRVASDTTGQDPWLALTTWLEQFVEYATTKKAIIEALNTDTPRFRAWVEAIHQAGEPLLLAAQTTGHAREDISFEDVRLLMGGVAGIPFVDADQRRRLVSLSLSALRATHC